jgi:hypothetical protein
VRNISIYLLCSFYSEKLQAAAASVRDNENLVIHIAYWWKEFL